MARHENGLLVQGTPLGHASLTVTTTAQALPSLPTESRIRWVLIRTVDQPVNWRDDGTSPTSSAGMYLATGDSLVYNGDGISNLKLIRASGATANADVRIAYYGL